LKESWENLEALIRRFTRVKSFSNLLTDACFCQVVPPFLMSAGEMLSEVHKVYLATNEKYKEAVAFFGYDDSHSTHANPQVLFGTLHHFVLALKSILPSVSATQ